MICAWEDENRIMTASRKKSRLGRVRAFILNNIAQRKRKNESLWFGENGSVGGRVVEQLRDKSNADKEHSESFTTPLTVMIPVQFLGMHWALQSILCWQVKNASVTSPPFIQDKSFALYNNTLLKLWKAGSRILTQRRYLSSCRDARPRRVACSPSTMKLWCQCSTF